MIILQAWYAKAQKARAHPFHPTLYLRRGDLFEEFLDIEPSEFVVFARQVLLEFPPFSVRSSAAASWDGVFQALDAGKGLREFWQQ
ncbi:hypothetical protein DL93DRAFT_2079567 [Clavulina sp. PMI_390]|nr:hypothetical protein DL93DRAFT_2079567 [Clavulina sp. PMI_390]